MPKLRKLFHSPMKELYDEQGLPKEIRRSLDTIFSSNCFGSIFGVVGGATTAAMVGLATQFGASDLTFGIMEALPQVASLLQLPFSSLMNRSSKSKLFMLLFGFPARFMWVLIGLLPLLFSSGSSVGLGLLVGLFAAYSVLIAVPNIAWYNWLGTLAPEQIRSRWLSTKETICAVISFAAGLLVSLALDRLQGNSKYAVVFVTAGLIGMVDIGLYGFVKEVPIRRKKAVSFGGALSTVMKNKPFIAMTCARALWCFVTSLFSPHITPYAMNVLNLSYTQVMLFGTMTATVVTVFAMPKWGKLLAEKESYRIFTLSSVIASFTPLFFLMAQKGSIWSLFLYNFFGAMFWCGANLSAMHMQLEYSSEDIRPTYLAMYNCIAAVGGNAGGSLLGGFLLELAQKYGWQLGSLDRYQTLFLFSAVLRTFGMAAMYPLLHKHKPIRQE